MATIRSFFCLPLPALRTAMRPVHQALRAACPVPRVGDALAPAHVASRTTSVSPAQPTRSRTLSPIPVLAALARVGPRVLLLRVVAAVAAIAAVATIAAVAGVVLTTVARAED